MLTSQTGQVFPMRKWQMQEAKAKFGEVVRKAATEGPQFITFRGAETAVILSIDEYRKLNPTQRPSFVEHILNGPKLDDDLVDLINERSKDMGRDIDL